MLRPAGRHRRRGRLARLRRRPSRATPLGSMAAQSFELVATGRMVMGAAAPPAEAPLVLTACESNVPEDCGRPSINSGWSAQYPRLENGLETRRALAPAMRPSVLAARVSFFSSRQVLRSQREGRYFRNSPSYFRQRFDLDRSRRNRGGSDKVVHSVAFLSWSQHPEPTSSWRAMPLLLFQQSPGVASEN